MASTTRDVFDAFTHMTRQPDAVGLDLKCEIAANNVAKARLQAMYEQYGAEMMNAVAAEMIQYTETVLRNRIREISDGSWSEELAIDADGPRMLRLTLRKQRDQLTFDFSGTDKQVSKGINLPYHGTAGFCFGAILSCLVYDLPKGIPKIHVHDGKPAQGFGIFLNGRLAVYYSYQSDLGDGWEDPVVPCVQPGGQ